MKNKELLPKSKIRVLIPILFLMAAGVLIPGCQNELPDENLIGKEEVHNNMGQFEDKKITVPPIDQNVPAKLATATLAMG